MAELAHLFPLAFLVYTLIRGPLAHWYPYPFLDPSHGGYGRVVIYSGAIALEMFALSFLTGWIGNVLGRKARGA